MDVTNSKSQDRNLVSSEGHEIEYIHQQFPNHSHDEVRKALESAKSELKGSEDRNRIMEIMRRKLK